MWNLEKFIAVNLVEGFSEVHEYDSSLFSVIMYFLNDAPESNDLTRPILIWVLDLF